MGHRLNYRYGIGRLIATALIAIVTVACQGMRRETNRPDDVATLERPAESPSGDYLLVVVSGQDSSARFQSFEIWDRESNELLYASPERFDRRHVTYFLWDDQDRVWVYSGDVGTFFWEQSEQSWIRRTYAQSDVPAPDFLREMRPDWHQQ